MKRIRVRVRAAGEDDPHGHTEVRKRPLPPKAPPQGWPPLVRCTGAHCPHGWFIRGAAPDVCRCGAVRGGA